MPRFCALFILITSFGLVLPTGTAYATGQIADVLIHRGDTFMLLCNPLEPYFEERGARVFPGWDEPVDTMAGFIAPRYFNPCGSQLAGAGIKPIGCWKTILCFCFV